MISGYTYNVNHLGQRIGVSKAGTAFSSARTIDWGYNNKGEVVKADSSVNTFDRAYQYDGIGNRLKSADSLALPTSNNYTPNVLNQYTAVNSLSPGYDDDGNMTSGPLPANLTANSTLVWDAENRLTSTTVSSVTTTYLYDAQSRRIATTTGTNTTVFVYDGWNPIAEYSAITLSKTYTWGMDLSGSMQGAGGVGGLLAVTDTTGSYFPTFDGNGNVSEYLDGTGAIAAHYEYDPFGRETISNGTNPTGFVHRFSTKPLDSATGLLYYGYRWYDPQTGRWPSRDPIMESGGLNLYGFVRNNGVTSWDRLGLQIKHPGGGDKHRPPPVDPRVRVRPKPPGPPGPDPDLEVGPPIVGPPPPAVFFGYYFAVARAFVKLKVDQECIKGCGSARNNDEYINRIKAFDGEVFEHIEFYKEGPKFAPWPFGPLQGEVKSLTEADAAAKAIVNLENILYGPEGIALPCVVIEGDIGYEILFPAEFKPAPPPQPPVI